MTKVICKPAMPMRLSPNFFLSELTTSEMAERRGIDNQPDAMALANLFKVAALLEEVRALLGNKPISPSSGYRAPALNKAVGGSDTSDHMTGEAVDFRCPSFGNPADVARAIAASGVKFGQLIFEGTWVHISLPNRAKNQEVLTAKFARGKKTRYIPGIHT